MGGETLFLAGNDSGSLAFQVSVFDVTSGAMTKTFDATDLRLKNTPVTQDEPGNIRADGNYCVVICDQNEVTDNKIIKVIGVSSGTPPIPWASRPLRTGPRPPKPSWDILS